MYITQNYSSFSLSIPLYNTRYISFVNPLPLDIVDPFSLTLNSDLNEVATLNTFTIKLNYSSGRFYTFTCEIKSFIKTI